MATKALIHFPDETYEIRTVYAPPAPDSTIDGKWKVTACAILEEQIAWTNVNVEAWVEPLFREGQPDSDELLSRSNEQGETAYQGDPG